MTLNSPPRFSLSKARACEKFNRQILTEILKRPEIQTVVLSALWSYLLSDETWKFVDNQAIPAKRSVHEVVNQLQKTVLVLQQAGRKVLLVAPPPSSSFNLGKCALKKHQNIVGFGSHPECSINLNRDTQLNEFLRIVEETNIAPVYRFEPLLCESDRCASQIGEVIIYRDGGHLSYEGSVLLGALDNWPVLFQQLAR